MWNYMFAYLCIAIALSMQFHKSRKLIPFQNPMNWSRAKKFLVTFFICQLTFSIYIGSAIYTPGEETIVQGFGVSQEKATLGLTLFVAG